MSDWADRYAYSRLRVVNRGGQRRPRWRVEDMMGNTLYDARSHPDAGSWARVRRFEDAARIREAVAVGYHLPGLRP